MATGTAASEGHHGEMDDSPDRRVIGAAFPDHETAQAAEDELRDSLELGEDDLELADAGGDASRRGILSFVAARFLRRRDVEAIVVRHSGQVVADVAESRAERPRPRHCGG